MKTKLLSVCTLFVGFLGFSQTKVYFKYDDAGNQRYRGLDANAKQAPENLLKKETEIASLNQSQIKDEKMFWEQIRLYPVPVNDVLTIDWTEEVDALIEFVSLYQHSTIHWKFQQKNIPNLNKQIKINMIGYDWGVYIIRFTLKDGRTFSKNITKK